MTQTREQIQRDINPTPPAVFAMCHWHNEYARSGLGSMGFWDSLTGAQRRFCEGVVLRMSDSMAAHAQPIEVSITMNSDDVAAVANAIARDIMTPGGSNVQAERLVMHDAAGRQLAGWSKTGLKDRLRKILTGENTSIATRRGAQGGRARAAALSPERRSEISRVAGVARWAKRRKVK